MNKKMILQNLQHHDKWLRDQTQATIDGGYRAVNVMVGCVQIINYCGQSIRQWVDRDNGRQKMLGRILETYATRRGRMALSKLVALTIAAVQANTWVDDFGVGALPVNREPVCRSDAHVRAMQEGKRRARERQGESLETASVRAKVY